MLKVSHLTGFNAIRNAGGGATDPDFSNVVFLSSWDGADESTSFTDESPLVRTVVTTAGAKLDSTVVPNYGYTSMLYTSTAGDCATLGVSNHNDYGTVWSIETDLHLPSLALATGCFGMNWGGLGTDSWFFLVATDGAFRFYSFNGGTARWDLNSAAGVISAATTHQIAMSSDGTKIRVFVDGVLKASVTPASTQLGNDAGDGLGTMHFGGGTFFDNSNVRMSETRITKGVCRSYLGVDTSYIPSIVPFPRS